MADFGMKYLPELPKDADSDLRDAYNKIREVTTYIQERLKLTNTAGKKSDQSIKGLTAEYQSSISSRITVVTESRSLSIGANDLVFEHKLTSIPEIIVNELPTSADYTYGLLLAKNSSDFTVRIFASVATSQTLSFLVG